MKLILKIPYLFSGIVLLCLVLNSCNKPDVVTSAREGNIYIPAAAAATSFNLLLTDTAQNDSFWCSLWRTKFSRQGYNS